MYTQKNSILEKKIMFKLDLLRKCRNRERSGKLKNRGWSIIRVVFWCGKGIFVNKKCGCYNKYTGVCRNAHIPIEFGFEAQNDVAIVMNTSRISMYTPPHQFFPKLSISSRWVFVSLISSSISPFCLISLIWSSVFRKFQSVIHLLIPWQEWKNQSS